MFSLEMYRLRFFDDRKNVTHILGGFSIYDIHKKKKYGNDSKVKIFFKF